MAQTDLTTKEEMVFKPVYPARMRLSVYMYPIGILACIYFVVMAAISRSIFPNLLFAAVFAFTLFSMPMIVFREAVFGERIILKRYFMPHKYIRYEDVVDLTSRGLVAKRGGIPLMNVQNRAEFEKIIRRLAAQRKIKLAKK